MESCAEKQDLESSEGGMMTEELRSVLAGDFTPQMKRILSLLSYGYSNKQIAFSLRVQETTVKCYVSKILKSFRCSNRTQAALLAFALRRDISIDIPIGPSALPARCHLEHMSAFDQVSDRSTGTNFSRQEDAM